MVNFKELSAALDSRCQFNGHCTEVNGPMCHFIKCSVGNLGGGGGATINVPNGTPPQLCVKTLGRGARGYLWGGSARGCRWGFRPWGGGVSKVGGLARDPLLPHAYLQGGCVSRVCGYGGMYAIIALSRGCREESIRGRCGAPLPPSPFPLPPCCPAPPGYFVRKILGAWLERGVKRKNGWSST